MVKLYLEGPLLWRWQREGEKEEKGIYCEFVWDFEFWISVGLPAGIWDFEFPVSGR